MADLKQIGKNETALVFQKLRAVMEENREELTRLDAALGDGDLGLTMAKAFTAVDEAAPEFLEKAADPGKFFTLAGMRIGKEAPSTMGTLLAAGFMRGGKAVSGKEALDAPDFTAFLSAFADAIASMGGAARGDKTVLDVLYPALEACKAAADGNAGLAGTLTATLAGAEKGLEDCKGFMAKHGRPRIFREKTVGLTDPGSFTGVLILRAFCEALIQ